MNDEELIDLNQHLNEELTRVRGLLQRMYELVRDGVLVRNVDEDDVFGSFVKQAFRLTATLRETELALAESADIGKLDTADKCSHVASKEECAAYLREPEKLNNAQKPISLQPMSEETRKFVALADSSLSQKCCDKPADDLIHTCRASHDYVDHDCHPYRESSLSSKEKK
jgi:hypothetical protein